MESGLPTIGAGGQVILPGTITLRPTPYRYAVLIERAKQLISLAQQIEAAFLSTLEKRDAEFYNVLKARQEARLSRAGVRLQELRLREAEDGVNLAELQRERAQIQENHFSSLLEGDRNAYEILALAFLYESLRAPDSVSFDKTGPSVSVSPSGKLQTLANIFSMMASHERLRQDWKFQANLARQDIRIGSQQVRIAEDHVRVVGQERHIA